MLAEQRLLCFVPLGFTKALFGFTVEDATIQFSSTAEPYRSRHCRNELFACR